MLLIIEALLILAALGQDHRAGGIELNMAPNSVDDRYDGCTKKMEELVDTEYLRKELDESEEFKEAWEAGEKKFTEKRDNIARKYLIAIYVYTSNRVYVDFNKAVRTGKEEYTHKKFTWYSLHFLLTKALQILKKQQNTSFSTIYRGTQSKFQGRKGKIFRFGSFTSFSLNKVQAKKFAITESSETGTCFEINDYKGAELTKYSKYCFEEEVLIPPYEKFKVTAVKTKTDEPDLWCDTVYILESSGIRSDLNCALTGSNILSNLLGCCGKG